MIATTIVGPFGRAERLPGNTELWHIAMLNGAEYVSRFEDKVRHYVNTSERHECIHALSDWTYAS